MPGLAHDVECSSAVPGGESGSQRVSAERRRLETGPGHGTIQDGANRIAVQGTRPDSIVSIYIMRWFDARASDHPTVTFVFEPASTIILLAQR